MLFLKKTSQQIARFRARQKIAPADCRAGSRIRFDEAVFDGKNLRARAEFFDEAFFRGGDESLRFIAQEFEQLRDAFIVELGVDIVEQKERIFLILLEKDRHRRELQDQERASLLPARTVFSEVVPVEQNVQVVAVRA